MPAPKDPEKYKIWKEKCIAKLKSRQQPWNKGKLLKGDPEYEEYLAKLSESQLGKHTESPSEETRHKISDSLKGKKKDKEVSDETRKKLSKASKGRKLTEETKQKLRDKATGRLHTDAAKAKMSESRKGKPGHTPSEETKKQISESLKGNPKPANSFGVGSKHTDEAKAKISVVHKGKSLTDATRQKISQALKGRKRTWYSPGMSGKTLSIKSRKKISDAYKRNGPNAGTFQKGRLISPEEIERLATISTGHFKQGFHNSPKAGRVRYRSSYELTVYESLDKDDNVIEYLVEPIIIQYEFNGTIRQYLPDLKVMFKGGDWLIVEVKPAAHIKWPKNQAKFAAAISQFGDNFEIWSEDLIF